MFDDLFGGLFDFDGDGTTDIGEEAIGFAIMNDAMAEENVSDTDDYYGDFENDFRFDNSD